MASRWRPDGWLRGLLSEAGWTGQQLAREVNALGAESGLTLRYDRTSVAHWLAGTRPNDPVPELIAEALSRRLGRDVREHPAGGSRPGPGQQAGEDDAAARLVQLQAGRRALHRAGVYTIPPLPAPDWTQATPGRPPGLILIPGRIGRDEAEGAQVMGRVFYDADRSFGGGHSVAALAGYLAYDIAPKLRTRATHAARQLLFTAATELTYLCAFMYFDLGQHAAAQRYYTAALELAAENHDAGAYATTLRAMSVQAHILGHHRQALDLADAAVSSAPGSIPPGTRAFLHGQVAVAAAGAGDKRTALYHLTRAESFLIHGTDAGAMTGNYHQASLAHQRAAVLSALGDIPGAARAMAVSVRHRPAAERRSRVITLAELAQLQLRQGHLEEAAATWHQFLDDYRCAQAGPLRR
jgi:hypothetical protein